MNKLGFEEEFKWEVRVYSQMCQKCYSILSQSMYFAANIVLGASLNDFEKYLIVE